LWRTLIEAEGKFNEFLWFFYFKPDDYWLVSGMGEKLWRNNQLHLPLQTYFKIMFFPKALYTRHLPNILHIRYILFLKSFEQNTSISSFAKVESKNENGSSRYVYKKHQLYSNFFCIILERGWKNQLL
jgi:hypothetical protein